MAKDRSQDRWDKFTGLATFGELGESLKNKMFLIPGEKRGLLKKVTDEATKAGQVVRDNAHQFPGNFTTIRAIGLKAFLFGWMTDDEICELVKKKGWK